MNRSLADLKAADAAHRKTPPRAYALLGTPHTGTPPRVVRVSVIEIYEWMQCAAVHEINFDGTDKWARDAAHILPLSCVASDKTLAAKTAAFTAAPESRPPLSVAGMTDSGAANPQPQTA